MRTNPILAVLGDPVIPHESSPVGATSVICLCTKEFWDVFCSTTNTSSMCQSSFVTFVVRNLPTRDLENLFFDKFCCHQLRLVSFLVIFSFRHQCPLSLRRGPVHVSHSGTRSPGGHFVAGTEIPRKCLSPKLPSGSKPKRDARRISHGF